MSLSVSQLIKGYSNNINCILERLLVDIRYRTCVPPDTKSHPLDLAIRSLIYVFIYLFIRSSVHYIIQMSLEETGSTTKSEQPRLTHFPPKA